MKRVLFSRVPTHPSSSPPEAFAAVNAPYPPPHHLLSDLGLEIDRRGGDLCVRLSVSEPLLDASGAVRAGVLGLALDVFAGTVAVDAARPDWALTSELAVHRLAAGGGDRLEVRGRVLRSGRTQLLVEADVRGDDVAVAFGQIGFTRVPRRDDTPDPPRDDQSVFRFGPGGAQLAEPLLDALHVVVRDEPGGELELPLSPYVRNSVGGLQGGVTTVLADAAASAAAASRLGPSARVEELSTRYLALGREGPVRSRVRALRASDGEALLRVELRDAGRDDRLVAVAVASARR